MNFNENPFDKAKETEVSEQFRPSFVSHNVSLEPHKISLVPSPIKTERASNDLHSESLLSVPEEFQPVSHPKPLIKNNLKTSDFQPDPSDKIIIDVLRPGQKKLSLV